MLRYRGTALIPFVCEIVSEEICLQFSTKIIDRLFAARTSVYGLLHIISIQLIQLCQKRNCHM